MINVLNLPKFDPLSLLNSSGSSLNPSDDKPFQQLFCQMQSMEVKISMQNYVLYKQGEILYKQGEMANKEIVRLNGVIEALQLQREAMASELTTLRELKQKQLEKQQALEGRRQKKRMRKQLPPLDRLTFQELKAILKLTSGSEYAQVRTFAAIIMLYITGLRASNLCRITIRHLEELLETGVTVLPLVKGGSPRHTIKLSQDDLTLLCSASRQFKMLCEGRDRREALFIGKGNRACKNKAIDSNFLKKTVN